MEVGKYAEYEFESESIVFLNRTYLANDASLTYRWTCLELNGTFAKLNISISFVGEKQIFLSTLLYVNLVNREVIMDNGTLMGRTRLWAFAYPEKGVKIFWENPPYNLTEEVIDVGSGWSQTPQGAQKIFILDASGAVQGRAIAFSGLYDLDTGIMIDGSFDDEPTLRALGIIDVGRVGVIQFKDTNINLGPKELWPEILNLLLFVSPMVVFMVILVLVYRRRTRKRNNG